VLAWIWNWNSAYTLDRSIKGYNPLCKMVCRFLKIQTPNIWPSHPTCRYSPREIKAHVHTKTFMWTYSIIHNSWIWKQARWPQQWRDKQCITILLSSKKEWTVDSMNEYQNILREIRCNEVHTVRFLLYKIIENTN